MIVLTHRQRIQACISDPTSLDRPPVALWRHFPVDDQSSKGLADSTLAFQAQFDFDLVKVTPASSFCLKDWGVEDVWEGNTEGTRRITKNVIENPRDWENLKILDPFNSVYLSEQLTCLSHIRTSINPDVPIIQTIFSPLAQAKNLVGKSNLSYHVKNYPDSFQKGLSIIAESTRRFIDAIFQIGIDGVFYAIQHAQSSELSEDDYRRFGIPNDILALETANAFWCNILHLHGKNIYFDLMKPLFHDFQVINWHDQETGPSLGEGLKIFDGVVCGGVGQKTVTYGNRSQIVQEVEDAFAQTFKQRLIIGTGCVLPIIAPYGNALAIRNSVEDNL